MHHRSDVNTTVATAIQRIGDLCATTLDFYSWVVLFCGDEFKRQLAAVQFSILATPSAAVELRRSYDHTRRILEVHAYGVAMLSAMGRAKLELWLERGQIAPRLRRIVLRHTL